MSRIVTLPGLNVLKLVSHEQMIAKRELFHGEDQRYSNILAIVMFRGEARIACVQLMPFAGGENSEYGRVFLFAGTLDKNVEYTSLRTASLLFNETG